VYGSAGPSGAATLLTNEPGRNRHHLLIRCVIRLSSVAPSARDDGLPDRFDAAAGTLHGRSVARRRTQ